MADYKHVTPNWTTDGRGGDILTMIVDCANYAELLGGKTTEVEELPQGGAYTFTAKFWKNGMPEVIGFLIAEDGGLFTNTHPGGARLPIMKNDLYASLQPLDDAFGPKTRN